MPRRSSLSNPSKAPTLISTMKTTKTFKSDCIEGWGACNKESRGLLLQGNGTKPSALKPGSPMAHTGADYIQERLLIVVIKSF